MIKAVIFDMDGVMIDSEAVYLQYLLEAAREKNPEVRLEQLFPMVGATKRESWEVYAAAVNNGQTWEELREEFKAKDIYSDIDYRKIFRTEMRDVLETLRCGGYLLAVASSTHLVLVERVLRENRIFEYFQSIVSGEQFKKSKPEPEIYLHTAALLGVGSGQCLAVEDSTVGITAAFRAGMKIAALIDDRFGFDQSLADFRIESLTMVPEILKSLDRS